ncbi:MAG TPA: hypothetical protein VFK37_02875 [Bacillales bacterium]|nr:hypothetical protein [Bacillales bacterium]
MVLLFILLPVAFLFLLAFIMDWRAKKAGNKIDFDEKSHNTKDPYRQIEAENMKTMTENNFNSFNG